VHSNLRSKICKGVNSLKDDKILVAGIIGVVAAIGAEIFAQIMVLTGVAKHSLFALSSMIITLDRPTFIIGFFVTSAVAGVLSVILYLMFLKLGAQHLIIKSIGISIVMWIVLELVFTFAIERKIIEERPLSGYYGHLIDSIIFGIVLGALLKRYLFNEKKA
jgi:hypothetical protein